ncbi:hypothetical protein DNU06_16155 [Putridiphycobacter roseus]|uniref:Uncharacterized protein n=1 Tax=Putridiphycobacter roseus TaxID=2219161 RepID=A0A2W1MWN3_9FLAO|nr:hypothetical protein DNU06_16155 [Putridiphycobacter roseus]
MKMISKIFGLVAMLFYTTNFSLAQCVMCKAQAEAQWEENGSGINTGIIYIMVIPYIILFAIFHKQIFRFFKNWRNMN